jgi:hypothetical protein
VEKKTKIPLKILDSNNEKKHTLLSFLQLTFSVFHMRTLRSAQISHTIWSYTIFFSSVRNYSDIHILMCYQILKIYILDLQGCTKTFSEYEKIGGTNTFHKMIHILLSKSDVKK